LKSFLRGEEKGSVVDIEYNMENEDTKQTQPIIVYNENSKLINEQCSHPVTSLAPSWVGPRDTIV
jgi:hypothetical protein